MYTIQQNNEKQQTEFILIMGYRLSKTFPISSNLQFFNFGHYTYLINNIF